AMSAEEIAKELLAVWPESFEKRDEERRELPDLPNAKRGKVVMRVAPNPNGPPHLGHAKQLLLNWFYVRKYDGKYILRFDDTDPKNKVPMKESYVWFQDEAKWLGVKPDVVMIASDRLDVYYDYAKKLIEMGKAYVCTCDVEKFRDLKEKKKACPCRDLPINEQLSRWEKMFTTYKEGEAVYRVKTELDNPNPALREWPGFRIIDNHKHPRSNARVWPLLNFNSSIDDHLTGVTHILRGRDLDFTEHQQRYLYDYFGWTYPNTVVNGMLSIEGVPAHKSEILKGIKNGEYSGWDDPRLGTLMGLRKAGVTPEGIKQLIWDLGVRKNNVTITRANLEAAVKKAAKCPTFVE
ncbi:glutamate--tRNA ligase, partial [Candidatus Micrarchaeota archaeon]|nr:glutamate--tRNA ligase [Candidatus Micrarchaeota archaeon]